MTDKIVRFRGVSGLEGLRFGGVPLYIVKGYAYGVVRIVHLESLARHRCGFESR